MTAFSDETRDRVAGALWEHDAKRAGMAMDRIVALWPRMRDVYRKTAVVALEAEHADPAVAEPLTLVSS